MLAPLLAAILSSGVASLGQDTSGKSLAVSVDDEGVFDIFLAGRPVGSESFRIHSSPGEVEAQAEIRLRVEQNGRTVSVQSFPHLVLDSQLHPVSYAWSQKGSQSSRLDVDFRGKFAKVRYKTVDGSEDDRDFQLLPDVAILDDNVFHHYQLIAARYLAMGGGKQTFHVFVPQEALPSLLTVEDMGAAAGLSGGAATNLRHLLITTDVTQIDLWIDDLQHLERVSVPASQLEVIRKR